MSRKFLLGIDVSTTSAKALLIDTTGKVVASASSPLSVTSPHPLWSEQDPIDWWDGVAASIKTVLREAGADGPDVSAIGLTGQMHGLVLLDESGDVLRPAILWNDQRTARECDEIRRRLGRDRLIGITGNDALTGFTAPKILWVARNEPGIYSRVRHMLLPKDYVRYRLSGGLAMDKADGSGTLLFDVRTRDWSPEVLSALAIPAAWLPPTFEGPEITGTVSKEAALRTGLREGTPIVAGGGDQAAGAVGMGAIDPGTVAVTLGTSGVVFAPTSEPLIEPDGRLHAFCHALPGRWHLMGVMLNAAGSLQWYRDTIAPGMEFTDLVAEAALAPPGSEGLLFLPYLSGERTPHADPMARGAWVGLTSRHRREHLTRSVLEGVAFGMKDCFELLISAGIEPVTQVRAGGGGARSSLWRQILADVLRVDLLSMVTSEGAAFGAAILAGVGAGYWTDVPAACAGAIQISTVTRPDEGSIAGYERAYALYRALYPALRATNTALGESGTSG